MVTKAHQSAACVDDTSANPAAVDGVHLFCPAKLNLFLHITGQKTDGYHTLQSVFTCIDIGDELTITPATNSSRLITLTGAQGLTNRLGDNLIIKAADALHQYAQHQYALHQCTSTQARTKHASTHDLPKHRPMPCNIHLTKRLPTGSGLGGGSSNAGMTLLGLNRLWQLGLDNATLQAIGQKLGADIPFFVANTSSAIVEGIGEVLTPMALPPARYLLVFPKAHNNTQAFFAQPTLKKDSPVLSHFFLKKMASDTGFATLSPHFYNAFEHIARQSRAIDVALRYLETISSNTHTTPRLTGTGSTVFLPIPHHIDEQTLTFWAQHAPYKACVAHSYRPPSFANLSKR